jgi:prevent-host-death family protein
VQVVPKTINVSEARDELGDTVDRVARNGQRVTLTRRGKAVAAIVSTDDLALLEALEERGDVEDGRQADSAQQRGDFGAGWRRSKIGLGHPGPRSV